MHFNLKNYLKINHNHIPKRIRKSTRVGFCKKIVWACLREISSLVNLIQPRKWSFMQFMSCLARVIKMWISFLIK